MNIFMETCAGKQFPLPQPDPNLTVVKQTQRDIKHIIIHCTGGSKTSNPARTLSFFFNPDDPQKEGLQGRLFERPGYHWLIEQNGDATHTCPDELRSQGILADAGVTNTNSIQITWIGGYKGKFDISDAQASTIKTLIDKYLEIYEDAKLLGHNQISDKECPNIWVPSFAATLGYKSKNIGNTIFGNINFFYDENNQTKERDDVVLLDEYQQRAEELANKLI